MPRIVSLIASATEIVYRLGLTPYQVGRSHECNYPPEILSLPVCTKPSFPVDGNSAEIDLQVKAKLRSAVSIYEVSGGMLDRLQPTHIITQTQCKVCAVSLDDVERAIAGLISSRPKIIALEPNSLADIWDDIRRVARACEVEQAGEDLIANLRHRIGEIEQVARRQASTPRVACIEWHEPLMAAGNWVPELVGLANGENLFGQAGLHSPWMTWQELQSADPDVIVTMPCGFDLARTRAEMYWLTQNSIWPKLSAVRTGRVYLTDGDQYMNRPGPRVVESLRILAEILHPGAFEPTLEGIAWERL